MNTNPLSKKMNISPFYFSLLFLFAFVPISISDEISISSETIIERSEINISSTIASIENKEDFSLAISTSICEEKMDFKEAIIKLRIALQAYLQKNYRYPKSLQELFPFYIKCMPAIKITDDYLSSVRYIRTNSYDKDYKRAIDDKTAWLYFSDPQSIYFGLILINSNAYSQEGIQYFRY